MHIYSFGHNHFTGQYLSQRERRVNGAENEKLLQHVKNIRSQQQMDAMVAYLQVIVPVVMAVIVAVVEVVYFLPSNSNSSSGSSNGSEW